MKVKDYVEDLSVDGRPTLTWIVKKQNFRVQMGSTWRQQESVASLTLAFHENSGKFDQLGHYKLLKKIRMSGIM
jgi:hypothetical protein